MTRHDLRDGVCWHTFDRQDRLGTFAAEDYRGLHAFLSDCSTDDSVRVAVLTGTGCAFLIGADCSRREAGSGDRPDRRHAGDESGELLRVLATFDKPLLAAVNGVAVGFGAALLLYCDVVLMAESSRLRLPLAAMGVVPEAAGSVRSAPRTRWSDAARTTLSSEWIDASSAVQMGLAWRSVLDSDLDREATETAGRIAALDSVSVRAAKRAMTAGRARGAMSAWVRETDEFRRLLTREDRIAWPFPWGTL